MKELNEDELIKLGFEIVRFREPKVNIGIDRFYKLDYAILTINKGSGFSDKLVIRFNKTKIVLDGFYSVRFYTVQDVIDLISCLTKIKK
jgi:hypothetical protein